MIQKFWFTSEKTISSMAWILLLGLSTKTGNVLQLSPAMNRSRKHGLPFEQLGAHNSNRKRRFFIECQLWLLKSVIFSKQFPLQFSTLGVLLEWILPCSFTQKEISPPPCPSPHCAVDRGAVCRDSREICSWRTILIQNKSITWRHLSVPFRGNKKAFRHIFVQLA